MNDTLSEDGKWVWDGSRWSAKRAVITGSIIPRALAWTLLGGLPLGALLGLFLGPFFSRIDSRVGIIAVLSGMIAAEALVLNVVMRRTPRVSIEGGRMRVERIGESQPSSGIPVSDVSRVELARGSSGQMMMSEGAFGEGKVLIHLVDGNRIELGWDAFSGRASTLAWMLGVPLSDPAAEASQHRAAAARIKDPGREKRQQIVVYVIVGAVVIVVIALLFGPLLLAILQMITRR